MKQRALQLINYVNKVYGFGQQLTLIKDGRTGPQISLKEILSLIFFGVLVGAHSFNLLEQLLKGDYFNKLLGKKKTKGSADTFGYALARIDSKQLETINNTMIKKARYNKIYQGGTIDGFPVVAIDGTEILRTQSEHWSCAKCRRTVRSKDDGTAEIDYHENLVGAAYVGRPPNLILGLERIAFGEGETTAALRLLKKLFSKHCRYAEIIVFDALYAKAPVIHEVLSQKKIAVIRVKQENYQIIEDAGGLFSNRAADLETVLSLKSDWYEEDRVGKKYRYRVKIWDEENFNSWKEVNAPLRVLKIEETRISASGKELDKPVVTHLVTTAGKATLPTATLWRIMHRRWDVENKTFHDLKTYWGFGHSYHHEENAFMVMRWLTVLAYNLFNLFYYRRMHQYYAKGLSKKVLRWELLVGLSCLEQPLLEPG